MTTLTLKVPDLLARKIDGAAKRQHASRSAFIRRAVERYISEDLAENEQPSAYDLIRDFVGTVEGPRDLSTNPRHMEGYGK